MIVYIIRTRIAEWSAPIRQSASCHAHDVHGSLPQAPDDDVARVYETAMDDILFVRRFQRLGNLLRNRQRIGRPSSAM